MRGIQLNNLAAMAMLVASQQSRAGNEIVLRPDRIRLVEPTYAPRFTGGSKLYKPNGKREVVRRLRQIERGQLRVTA